MKIGQTVQQKRKVLPLRHRTQVAPTFVDYPGLKSGLKIQRQPAVDFPHLRRNIFLIGKKNVVGVHINKIPCVFPNDGLLLENASIVVRGGEYHDSNRILCILDTAEKDHMVPVFRNICKRRAVVHLIPGPQLRDRGKAVQQGPPQGILSLPFFFSVRFLKINFSPIALSSYCFVPLRRRKVTVVAALDAVLAQAQFIHGYHIFGKSASDRIKSPERLLHRLLRGRHIGVYALLPAVPLLNYTPCPGSWATRAKISLWRAGAVSRWALRIFSKLMARKL